MRWLTTLYEPKQLVPWMYGALPMHLCLYPFLYILVLVRYRKNNQHQNISRSY